MCFIFSMFFFKTSLWKHRKNTKKGATQIHQVQNCPLGVPKFPPVEEKKSKKTPRNSIHWKQGCGCTCLGCWDWTNGSRFVRMIFWVFCTFGKKGESNMCSCCFLIMPSPTFAIGIFNRDMIEFQLTTPTLMSNVWNKNDSLPATLLHGKWLGSFTHMKLVVSWGAWWWFFVDTWYLKRNPPITSGM